MKNTKDQVKVTPRLCLLTILWLSGLLMAGSESSYMPWVNISGVLLFAVAGILISRDLRTVPEKRNTGFLPGILDCPGVKKVKSTDLTSSNVRHTMRYAA